jgi:hypothetical protein
VSISLKKTKKHRLASRFKRVYSVIGQNPGTGNLAQFRVLLYSAILLLSIN